MSWILIFVVFVNGNTIEVKMPEFLHERSCRQAEEILLEAWEGHKVYSECKEQGVS